MLTQQEFEQIKLTLLHMGGINRENEKFLRHDLVMSVIQGYVQQRHEGSFSGSITGIANGQKLTANIPFCNPTSEEFFRVKAN
jgi:hypothetical protein